jgi:hypothetical protein
MWILYNPTGRCLLQPGVVGGGIPQYRAAIVIKVLFIWIKSF